MEIEKHIGKALDGEGILFVGAGFSRGSKNLRNSPLKSGNEFAAFLSAKADYSTTSSLEDAAEAYVDKFAEDDLIKEIQEEYTVLSIQPYHQEIATIPWRRIYTTNYDNVVETAFQLAKKRVTSITLGTDIYQIPKDHTTCIHFNGYVNSLNRNNIWAELKLTESSYITASIADSPWAMLFRQDIRLAGAIFFIGYSLYDLDIKRILFESDTLKDKCFFYLGTTPEESTKRRASRYGSVILDDAAGFAAKVKEVSTTYLPRSRKELNLLSTREYSALLATEAITDKSFLDLLLYGNRKDALIAESIQTGKIYYMKRGQIEDIFRQVSDGNRVFVICSDLGNGKSLLLDGLRIRAKELGYRVFDVYDHSDRVESELQAIAKLEGNVLVIIEEYQNWIDEIQVFRTNASANAVLVVTARNAVHDLFTDELAESTGVSDVPEVNVDILNDKEIEWIIKAFNEYGLWGTRAGDNKSQKNHFVSITCRKQLHAVLLKLFESPDIEKRLSAIAVGLKKGGEYYQVLLSILILTLMNHAATLDVLADIWGTDVIGRPSFKKDPLIKEFVNFDYYAVLVRSPVAAEYLLKKSVDAGTIVSVLTRMTEQVAKSAKISPRYQDIFKSLVRFSSVQLLLPEQGRRPALINYYESIKNLDGCRFNPLFWLQYAIATLVMNEIVQSGIYFETAYSLARQKGWNTFQIDNHYARFLMVQATQMLEYPEALENFRQARKIINRQIQDERRHYPYRVATAYQDLFDRFSGKLKRAEIAEIENAATTVLNKSLMLPDYRRKHKYVIECQKSLEYVVKRCREMIVKIGEESLAQQKDSADKK